MKPNQKINLQSLSVDDLTKLKRDMEIKAARLAAAVDVRSQQVNAPTGGAKYLKNLASGDALTINNVIWPFFFSATSDVLKRNGGQQQISFQVTQEAAFVFTELIKVVYAVDFDSPVKTIEYINPRDISGNGDANGLRFALVDGSSSRAYMDNYVPLDQVGAPFQPFVPDRPMMFMPLQQLQIDLVNNNSARDYVCFMIFKGYRIRIEGQQDLTNLVTG
jgi:hypothetical protein